MSLMFIWIRFVFLFYTQKKNLLLLDLDICVPKHYESSMITTIMTTIMNFTTTMFNYIISSFAFFYFYSAIAPFLCYC